MKNIYRGPLMKLIGKGIATAALYVVAYVLTQRIWR